MEIAKETSFEVLEFLSDFGSEFFEKSN